MKYGVLDRGRWVERAMQQIKNLGWGMIEMTIGIMAGSGNGVKHFWHIAVVWVGLMYFRHGVLCIVFSEDFS